MTPKESKPSFTPASTRSRATMSFTIGPRQAFVSGWWLIFASVVAAIRRTSVTFEKTSGK